MQAAGSSDNFDDMKGQALTLRAMIYFDLVRLYGQPYNEDKSAWGVPNILEPLDAMAQELRATVEQNYQTIVSDLTTAESLLSKSVKKGFVNYWANKALQTRVYLHMENWGAALTAAEDIINNGPYDLYAPNKWVDSWKSRWGSESIFELEMNSGENALSGTSSLGAYYARESHFNSNMGSYMASTAFLELFLAFLVTGVQVGVILLCQLAVGFFYFLGAGALFDTQHLIIIAFIFCHMIHLKSQAVQSLPLEGKVAARRADG